MRLEEVSELLSKADMADDEHRARSMRRRADRMLQSMSPAAFAAEHSRLSQELADASRRGDTPGARAAMADLAALERAQPQPHPDRYLKAAMAGLAGHVEGKVTRLVVPAVPGNNIWFRRRRRK